MWRTAGGWLAGGALIAICVLPLGGAVVARLDGTARAVTFPTSGFYLATDCEFSTAGIQSGCAPP